MSWSSRWGEWVRRRARRGGAHCDGPLGINLADATSIAEFQREHALLPDGVIGPLTRVVIRSLVDARPLPPSARSSCLALDITDETAIRDFQQSRGLKTDGVFGPQTRRAYAADLAPAAADPADFAPVRSESNDPPARRPSTRRSRGSLSAIS